MIKKEIIDQIREQSDIVQIISEHIPLKKVGRYYRALCPFHSEKSPSFYVSPERQIYHCFGCGAGGSVFTFLMAYEKITFPEAIKKLADRLGISIQTETTPYRFQPLLDACEFATNFFSTELMKSSQAVEYLKKRKINPETTARFRLGYAPSGNLLFGAAKKHGISEEILVRAGLIVKKETGYYDWFFDRLIFPIFSLSGKIIGFGARVLDDTKEPKYLNSPETEIFRKNENLYGLFQAKNYLYDNTPILVEGNFDLLSLVNNGINNVVAPLGTAFTQEQALLLRRFNNHLIIAFDADEAGKNATQRVLETCFKVNLEPRIIRLPDNFDPDKYINVYGKDNFNNLMKNALDFIDFLTIIKNYNSVFTKQTLLKELLDYIALMEGNIAQELYLNKISEVFKVTKETLVNEMRKKMSKRSTPTSSKAIKPSAVNLIEEQVLSLMVNISDYALMAKQELPASAFSSTENQTIAQIIYDTVETQDYSVARIIDSLEDEHLKKKVADLSFQSIPYPSKEEFEQKLIKLKASWVYQNMLLAKKQGDDSLVEKLSLEHYELKRRLTQTKK
ncbi:MAG: DNA primase [candidate division WOR-3 bacterium]|nr:DNA primase [candidate division WOR-3 bacterium]